MFFVKKEVNTEGLYTTCFRKSEHQQIILNSHLPFEDGFYVTEYDVVLKVHNNTIYALTEKGWEQNQSFFKLWYDGMTNFADISPKMVEELGLNKRNVVKASVKSKTKTTKPLTEGKPNVTKTLIEEKTNMADMPDCKEFVADVLTQDDRNIANDESRNKQNTVIAIQEEQLERFNADAYLVEYCEFMKAFYDQHKEEYAKRLDAYYASPGSRIREESCDSPKTISEELYQAALEKTKEILVLEKEEGWDFQHNIRESPYSLYEKIESWNRVVNNRIVNNRDNLISYRKATDKNSMVLSRKEQAELKDQLHEITRDLSRKRASAVKKYWYPLTLVSGVPGQYNEVLYYDKELNLMIEFSPMTIIITGENISNVSVCLLRGIAIMIKRRKSYIYTVLLIRHL